jgi:hypothetical protein
MQTIQQTLAADQTTRMHRADGSEFTRDELDAAFKKVQNKAHWKDAIDAVIAREDRDVTEAAVIFFAGCRPEFTEHYRAGFLNCRAVGYWEAIGS